jgi:Flp pilus assembly protein TadG
MRTGRRARVGQRAQAAIEMALVLPVMIVIVCGFVGMMLELRAENEFQTAVDLAAQAALVPPLGDQAASQADSAYAFSHTLNPSGSESGYMTVTTPINCAGPYLQGEIDLNAQGIPAPVTCTAQADLDFSKTPVGIFWLWSIQLSATADAYPPQYRQCQTTSGSKSPFQC